MRFNMRAELPVAPPFRLDLTVDALRRLAANVVDIVAQDGAYHRYFDVRGKRTLVRVTQQDERTLLVQASQKRDDWVVPIVEKMLGARVDLADWYERSAKIPWLALLAHEVRGVKPPRYASLWEACAHAIVFQQISIHAAGAIMRRTIETVGAPAKGLGAFAFPTPEAVLQTPEAALRAAGLSQNKVQHLRSAAGSIVRGEVTEEEIEALPTPEASDRLINIRGIGRWSAAVVLLRGFGRLDTFPMNDSGVARTIKLLSGDPEVNLDRVLETLGPMRGMLYYHLLLGRIRNLVPVARGLGAGNHARIDFDSPYFCYSALFRARLVRSRVAQDGSLVQLCRLLRSEEPKLGRVARASTMTTSPPARASRPIRIATWRFSRTFSPANLRMRTVWGITASSAPGACNS